MTAQTSPTDEIQWRNQDFLILNSIHSNSILFYFATSPWFDEQSKNNVFAHQAQHNPHLLNLISTREKFEDALRQASGLEFIVHQEPAESGPGQGTGVWVIRKQTRSKVQGKADELVVHADYYVVGEFIYQAPTFASMMNFRMATITTAIESLFDASRSLQQWTPSQGHFYKTPTAPLQATQPRGMDSRGTTPVPGSSQTGGTDTALSSSKQGSGAVDSRLAEESLMIHLRYGGDYMDENPILGKPGEFHFTSTGRKDKLAPPPPQAAAAAAAASAVSGSLAAPSKTPGALSMSGTGSGKKGEALMVGKTDKSPKPGTAPTKVKRKKSKTAGATAPS